MIGVVLGCGGVIAIAAAASILQGLVFVQMWEWFIMPQFGLPPLSVAAAIGLALTVGMLTRSRSITNADNKSRGAKIWDFVAGYFLAPLLTLSIGFIVKGFM